MFWILTKIYQQIAILCKIGPKQSLCFNMYIYLIIYANVFNNRESLFSVRYGLGPKRQLTMQTSLCPKQAQEERNVAMYRIITGNTVSRFFAEVQKYVTSPIQV
jgi:hypothetical protein